MHLRLLTVKLKCCYIYNVLFWYLLVFSWEPYSLLISVSLNCQKFSSKHLIKRFIKRCPQPLLQPVCNSYYLHAHNISRSTFTCLHFHLDCKVNKKVKNSEKKSNIFSIVSKTFYFSLIENSHQAKQNILTSAINRQTIIYNSFLFTTTRATIFQQNTHSLPSPQSHLFTHQ